MEIFFLLFVLHNLNIFIILFFPTGSYFCQLFTVLISKARMFYYFIYLCFLKCNFSCEIERQKKESDIAQDWISFVFTFQRVSVQKSDIQFVSLLLCCYATGTTSVMGRQHLYPCETRSLLERLFVSLQNLCFSSSSIHSFAYLGLLNFARPPSTGAKNDIQCKRTYHLYLHNPFPITFFAHARYLLNNIGLEKMRISKNLQVLFLFRQVCK